ncbi:MULTISPECIES: hypothetical protein [Bacteroides]|uniref:hypothetical protein n=1 Tax=Bacteroides TaxID=816 RepID=UPI00265F3A04|nr:MULTISPECIES: hypothetical protein [Bacteroides]
MMTSIITLLTALLTAAIGAFIGTLYGSKKLYEYQQSGKIATRKTALKAISILKKYAGQPYTMAQSDFNTSLSMSEKRAVLVALHKLGIPIIVPSTIAFKISDIQFSNAKIVKEELESIEAQLDNGNCDYLFYEDVENHFSSNLRLNTLRALAKRYVNDVMTNSRYENDNFSDPENWQTLYFTPGEVQAILVFCNRVHDKMYYEDNGNLKLRAIDKLIQEIEIGLWDNYLFWDYAAHQNMISQNALANRMFEVFFQTEKGQNQTKTPKKQKQ